MPVVVPVTVQSCDELWYDPELFLEDYEDLEEDDAISLIREATYILWRLTGEWLHGDQCWVEDYKLWPQQRVLILDKQPVVEVASVTTVDDCDVEGADLTGWCYQGDGSISLGGTQSAFWGSAGCGSGVRRIRVAYRIGSNIPVGSDRAVKRFVKELYNFTRTGKCEIPDRITSVSRQGVSWQIDPQSFLDEGRTGLSAVDTWIRSQNGSGLIRMYDPLKKGIILRSELVGCGPDCDPLEEGS